MWQRATVLLAGQRVTVSDGAAGRAACDWATVLLLTGQYVTVSNSAAGRAACDCDPWATVLLVGQHNSMLAAVLLSQAARPLTLHAASNKFSNMKKCLCLWTMMTHGLYRLHCFRIPVPANHFSWWCSYQTLNCTLKLEVFIETWDFQYGHNGTAASPCISSR